ncbi:MAG: AMP-binding protein, partial [Planctomycetes bacterium]|nr:AMP-binding protein [Planctomycetota bacterium]
MPRTVAELLEHASQRFADRVFLGAHGATCTFAAFAERARAGVAALRRRGLRRGDRVAVLLPRGADEACTLVAIMAAGGVAVPIHGKLKDDQVRHVLRDAEPRLCVTDGQRTVGLRDADDVLRDQVLLAPAALFDDAAAAASADPDGSPEAGDDAVMLYTSGSTGPAKGIVQNHGNLLRGAQVVADYLGLTGDDHILALLSFSFDYGLNQLLTALLVGCRLTAAEHLGVGELASLLRAHRPTGLAGVPSLWHEVAAGLEAGTLDDDDGRSLRYVTNSGGALRTADSAVLRARWPQVAVFAMYGLTEAFRSAFLPPDEFDATPESFGYAIDGVELLLVSPETGEVLEGPATGELVHAGDLVARGYWRRPEAEQRRFRPDPRGGDGQVVYSGDLVRRDRDGRHYFVARLDRMLKVHG